MGPPLRPAAASDSGLPRAPRRTGHQDARCLRQHENYRGTPSFSARVGGSTSALPGCAATIWSSRLPARRRRAGRGKVENQIGLARFCSPRLRVRSYAAQPPPEHVVTRISTQSIAVRAWTLVDRRTAAIEDLGSAPNFGEERSWRLDCQAEVPWCSVSGVQCHTARRRFGDRGALSRSRGRRNANALALASAKGGS
jgi:hypothetical protein